MDDALHQPLPVTVSTEFVELVVAAARHAHEIEARNHVPDDGADAYTFGTGRWRRTWYFLRQYLVAAGYNVDPDQLVLRALCDGFAFTFYNGGVGGTWDVNSYDPGRSARRARQAESNQLRLAFPGFDWDEEGKHIELTFLFAGSPEHGLEAAYLGLPTAGQEPWVWVREIWRREADSARAGEERTTRYTAYSAAPEGDLMLDLIKDQAEGSDGADSQP